MQNTRPTALTVYVVLSWIWITLLAYSVITSYRIGPLSADQIRAEKIQMLEMLDLKSDEDKKDGLVMVEESGLFYETFSANHGAIHLAAFFQILLGLISTIFMFKMRKVGFHLYIIYSLIPITIATYFYGSTSVGIGLMFCSGIMALLFLLLYGYQLKHMK